MLADQYFQYEVTDDFVHGLQKLALIRAYRSPVSYNHVASPSDLYSQQPEHSAQPLLVSDFLSLLPFRSAQALQLTTMCPPIHITIPSIARVQPGSKRHSEDPSPYPIGIDASDDPSPR
jgi:hypothetical protein